MHVTFTTPPPGCSATCETPSSTDHQPIYTQTPIHFTIHFTIALLISLTLTFFYYLLTKCQLLARADAAL